MFDEGGSPVETSGFLAPFFPGDGSPERLRILTHLTYHMGDEQFDREQPCSPELEQCCT